MPQMPSNRLATALRPPVCWVSFWPGLCVWNSSTRTWTLRVELLWDPSLWRVAQYPTAARKGTSKAQHMGEVAACSAFFGFCGVHASMHTCRKTRALESRQTKNW